MDRIFIGRKTEQEAFTKTIEGLGPSKTIFSFFGKSSPNRQLPRIFLISGGRNMGKRQLLKCFEQQCRSHPRLSWVLLDWNDLREAGSLPNDLPTMLTELHKAIGDLVGEQALRHFKTFATIRDNRHKLQGKVAQRLGEREKSISTIAQGIGGVAAAITAPVAPGLNTVVSPLVEYGVKAADKYLREYLSEDEYRLYVSPNDEYAHAFVQGLISLAGSRPLVIAQAGYEWIARNAELEAQWRTLALRSVLQKSENLVSILSGKMDLAEAYRQSFDATPQILYVADLKPFTAEEIQEAYRQSLDWSVKVHRQTNGDPLLVGDFVDYLNRTGQEPDAADLIGAADEDRASKRLFLRYLVETPQDTPETAQKKRIDRHKLYALALLRQYDIRALAVCWEALEGGQPLSENEVFERLRGIRRDYDFLFEDDSERLLPRYRPIIIEYSGANTGADADSFERGIVRKINKAALDHFQQLFEQRAASLPTLAERVADAEWRSLCLNVLHHKLRLDQRSALPDLVCRILEAANTPGNWLDPFMKLASDFDWKGHEFFDILNKGVRAVFSEEKLDDWSAVQKLWDEIERQWDKLKLPPLYRVLLSYRRGLLLTRSQQYGKAGDEIARGLDALPAGVEPEARADSVKALIGLAALLMFEKRDYEKAISVARRASQYAPENMHARQMEINGLLGFKDYAGAQALMDDLLRNHPEDVDLLGAQYLLHMGKGQSDEAKKVIGHIIEIQPEYARDMLQRLFEQQQKDPQFIKAMSEWQKDIGFDRASIESFSKLQKLAPEVQTELFTAYYKLMAMENPTPAEILSVRELSVRHLPDWPSEHLLLGVAYLNAGRLQDALSTFERARELAPDMPGVMTVPGLNLFWQGHYTEALPFLEASIKALPDNPGPQIMTVSCLLNLKRDPEAKQRAEEALALYPEDALLRWQYEAILIQLGEREKGLRMSRRAYRAAPDVIEKEFKALAYRPEAALKTIRQSFSEQIALGLGPEIGKTLAGLPPVELARLYFQLMRYELDVDESGNLNPEILISALAELISHKPESAALRIETANLYERLGKRERSIAILEEIVDKILSSTQNDIRRRLVGLYSAGGDWKSTLRHLREIEEPLTAEEYVLLAELLVQEGQFDKALVAYENSLALADDQDTERLDRFGLYNLGVDNFQRAEELFRKKIALRQDDAMGFSNLSEALYGQKKYEEAKDDAERALALAPDLPLPAARLFRICKTMGLLDEAERCRQKAVQNLSQADSYDQACILAILGDEEEALEQLERVIKATPEYRAWAQFDPDLRELRGNAVFQRLVSSAEPPTE